jgi:hypothetical protein
METMTMLGKTYTAIILALALVAGTATLTAASTSISQIDLSREQAVPRGRRLSGGAA